MTNNEKFNHILNGCKRPGKYIMLWPLSLHKRPVRLSRSASREGLTKRLSMRLPALSNRPKRRELVSEGGDH